MGVAGGTLEVDVKHNETTQFTTLLEPLNLNDVVVTFDALHTVWANLAWLATEKKAHYVAVVKKTSHRCMPGSGAKFVTTRRPPHRRDHHPDRAKIREENRPSRCQFR